VPDADGGERTFMTLSTEEHKDTLRTIEPTEEVKLPVEPVVVEEEG
jgi:hypothetical protein